MLRLSYLSSLRKSAVIVLFTNLGNLANTYLPGTD